MNAHRTMTKNHLPRRDQSREGGFLLLELMVTLTVLSVGLLAFLHAFQANFRANQDAGTRDQVQTALDNAVARLKAADFATLYATYQDVQLAATGFLKPDGSPASVAVHFDVNETSLPAAYGPLGDLNGDGLNTNVKVSTGYTLLPTRLTLSYQTTYGSETKTVYLVLAER